MKEYTKRKKGDSWEVIGHEGDVKGTHNTEKEADDQIAAIHANMKEAVGLLSPEIEEKIDWAFHPTTYNDNPDIHDPLIYVVVKDNFDEIEEMGFASDLRSIVRQSRGGFDERTILGVYSDIEQAKAHVRQIIKSRGLDSPKKRRPVKENFETEEQIRNTPRETKEAVLSAVFRKGENGEEPVLDPTKLSDEELDGMIAEYGDIFSKQQESLKKGPQFFEEVVSVLEEEGASEQDIVEALALHGGLHLEEAREIHQDLKRIQ